MTRLGVLALAGATVMGLARPVAASPILVNGNTFFTVNWSDPNASTVPLLTGRATVIITNYTASSFTMSVAFVRNTTATSPNIDARLTSFGFGLTPDATSFSSPQNGTIYSWATSNFAGFQSVDICGFAGQNCAGGASGGLNQGQSVALNDVMSIVVNGTFTNGVVFNPEAVKFQTSVGSFEFDGTVTPNCQDCAPGTTGILPTPEPASMVLLGTGLLGVVRFARRKVK